MMARRQDNYCWRIIATAVSFALFGLGGLIMGYLILPLVTLASTDHKPATRRCRYLIHRCFRLFIHCMQKMGVLTWEVRGQQQLQGAGQLVIANHPSLIDVVFLISLIPNATCIVKAGLYRNPFTRGPVSRAGYIANDNPQQLLCDGAAELERGTTFIIFPEGSRSVPDKPLHFQRGAAYLRMASHCPVSLVTIAVAPPTLVKGEKWYHIPWRRPHFQLNVCTYISGQITQHISDNQQARLLTRHWQQYFTQELSL
ncbi:MAG: lysophospholipid acyltransferase family protein [Parahaliea sp.]